MSNRIEGLSLPALKQIAEDTESWTSFERQLAKHWVEIIESDFDLTGVVVYNSPSYYFATDSGAWFHIHSEVYQRHRFEPGQRIRCKVVRNYNGKRGDRPPVYGYVSEALFDSEESHATP